jgi:acetaldehyde dehydrogenase
MAKVKVAILGSGNIGTDLMTKIIGNAGPLQVAALVGIEATSEGLTRARDHGVAVTHEGIAGFVRMREFADVRIVFDATSARAHHEHDSVLRAHDKQIIDLTPAAIGPYVVPSVNLGEHLSAPNLNMVTCGGQATIPVVAAVARQSKLSYAEIVASIASRSAGPGTRANIDEFTQTTARGLEQVGGAGQGRANIILNPAEPPMLMRNTVHCLCEDADEAAITRAVRDMERTVQKYVPGYRLKQDVQFQRFGEESPLLMPHIDVPFQGVQVSVFLQIEGAADYLPAYAGNLDIMTSAAKQTAERLVELRNWT